MIEVCGVGIERLPYEPVAVVGLVVDFAADVDRLPEPAALETSISGITLPRLAVPSGTDPLPAVLDRLRRGN